MTAKISLQDVSYTYGDGTQALRSISLDIEARQLFVLFGPARGGKSTLLRLLNRLSDLQDDASVEGKILLDGQDVFESGVNVSDLRRRVAMVFATPTPLPGTILQNLTYGLEMSGVRDEELLLERAERGLRLAALWDEVKDRLHTSAFALSGGQQQRLCLARSLTLEPDVILLDNPTSGLDPLSTATVEESLLDIKRRYTVIMVPHSVQQAARVADHAAFILDSELVETGDSNLFVNPVSQRTEDYVTGRFG